MTYSELCQISEIEHFVRAVTGDIFDYISKTLHLRCLAGFWISLWHKIIFRNFLRIYRMFSEHSFFFQKTLEGLLLFSIFKWFGEEGSKKEGCSVYERKFQFFQDIALDLFWSCTLICVVREDRKHERALFIRVFVAIFSEEDNRIVYLL